MINTAIEKTTVTRINDFVALPAFVLIQPLAGLLSDRIGRRPLLLFFGGAATLLTAVVKAELFPARIRALGVGLPYALTVAIFGGSTEYVALWVKDAGHEPVFFYYVAGRALISLVVYGFMWKSSTSSHIEREHDELVNTTRQRGVGRGMSVT